MFKFMKSKKGFTLVELMIVVVIMAILVAVAVPIYNAVTENARKKTCASNRRNIISQITNNVMSDPSLSLIGKGSTATFSIKTNSAGDGYSAITGADTIFSGGSATFEGWFNDKNKPICPTKNGGLKVEIEADANDAASLQVTVTCDITDHNA